VTIFDFSILYIVLPLFLDIDHIRFDTKIKECIWREITHGLDRITHKIRKRNQIPKKNPNKWCNTIQPIFQKFLPNLI
jgi:hypothetical protein